MQVHGQRQTHNSNYVDALGKICTQLGVITNHDLTIENIKVDNFNMCNLILTSFAAGLLSYCRLDSSLLNALRARPRIKLIDEGPSSQFKVIADRPQEQAV